MSGPKKGTLSGATAAELHDSRDYWDRVLRIVTGEAYRPDADRDPRRPTLSDEFKRSLSARAKRCGD
jgi:hypothetical protein